MTSLTDLRRLAEEATPGPWTVFKDDGGFPHCIDCVNAKIGGAAKLFDVRGWGYFTGQGHGALALDRSEAARRMAANADFVSAMRENAIPLLDRIEKAEADLARAHALLQEARSTILRDIPHTAPSQSNCPICGLAERIRAELAAGETGT